MIKQSGLEANGDDGTEGSAQTKGASNCAISEGTRKFIGAATLHEWRGRWKGLMKASVVEKAMAEVGNQYGEVESGVGFVKKSETGEKLKFKMEKGGCGLHFYCCVAASMGYVGNGPTNRTLKP